MAGSEERGRDLLVGRRDSRLRQIVDISAAQFAQRGYDATSLQDIAESVGIKKSSLYAHVSSKQELLRSILDIYITDMLDNATRIYASEATPAEKLREVIRMLYAAIGEFKNHVTVFFEEMRYLLHPEFSDIRTKRDAFERLMVMIVKDGIDQGDFVDFDPRIVTFHAVGVVTWSYRWFNPDGRMSIDEMTDLTMRLLIDGMKAR